MKLKKVSFYRVSSRFAHEDPAIFAENEGMKDMLRYEMAFLNRNFPGVIAFPTFQSKSGGTYPGEVTYGRWNSMGFKIEPLNTKKDDQYFALYQNFLSSASEWVSFRRKGCPGPLTPVPLKVYLEVKDTHEIDYILNVATV